MPQEIKVWLDKLRQFPEHGESVWHELKDSSIGVFLTLGQHHTRHRQKSTVPEPPQLKEQLVQFEKAWQKTLQLVPALASVVPEPPRLKAVELAEHFLLTQST